MGVMAKPTHRRYANKSHYQFFKDGERVGNLVIDVKLSENDLINALLEFAGMCDADKIILHWNARCGFVDEEVKV